MKAKMFLAFVAVAFSVLADVPAMPRQPAPPPPPPGVHLRPGMMWCDVCGGSGTFGRTWYGFRKTCRRCGGSGMLPRPAAPVPVHRPHVQPVPAHRPGSPAIRHDGPHSDGRHGAGAPHHGGHSEPSRPGGNGRNDDHRGGPRR
ncbi:MAG: hypothetical protein IKO72_14745 [Kiritimatiellae bacterium]|nr:hypothetical protein [Kiritimatiellia bacterium]